MTHPPKRYIPDPRCLGGMNLAENGRYVEYKEITQIQAKLDTETQRNTRLISLLQRAQTIITLDASLYTIWREDVGEELAMRKEAHL
jgi:hypothetical protein